VSWLFAEPFMQRALVAGLVVGIVAPLIGAFLVQRRLSLLGEATGHIAFAGVAVGIVAGVAPVPAALVLAVAGALAVEALRRRGVAGDLVLAFVLYAGIAGGAVLLSVAGAFDGRVLAYLFGQILTVTSGEVALVAALGAAVVLLIAVVGRALFALVVDETSAAVAGVPVGALGALLTVLVAVVVVLAMRVVGVLLVAALMVLPVGAAGMLARSFRATLMASSAIGAFAVVAGLAVARTQPVPPGPVIVLWCCVVFLVAAMAGRRGRAALRWSARAGGRLAGPDAHHPHPHSH